MAIAIVGLVGVVIGALLSGVAQDLVERRKQHVSTRAAARAIGEELTIAANKVSSATKAAEHPGWWSGTVVTRIWEDRFDALAAGISEELLAEVTRAYALIDSWNAEKAAAKQAGRTELTASEVAELTTDSKQLETTSGTLGNAMRPNPKTARQLRAVRRISAVGCGLLILVLLVSFLVIPEPT